MVSRDSPRLRVLCAPGVSSIAWVELLEPGVWHLLVSDMRDGTLSLVDPIPQRTARLLIGRFANPARVNLVDFDRDGRNDLIVADLGSYKPFDHQLGKVVWLYRGDGSQASKVEFEPVVLCDQAGRVADCGVGDFTGDRQLDLVVAEFGHRRNGSLRLLTNRSVQANPATFRATDSGPPSGSHTRASL